MNSWQEIGVSHTGLQLGTWILGCTWLFGWDREDYKGNDSDD